MKLPASLPPPGLAGLLVPSGRWRIAACLLYVRDMATARQRLHAQEGDHADHPAPRAADLEPSGHRSGPDDDRSLVVHRWTRLPAPVRSHPAVPKTVRYMRPSGGRLSRLRGVGGRHIGVPYMDILVPQVAYLLFEGDLLGCDPPLVLAIFERIGEDHVFPAPMQL
jgi:hypothetical protein